MNVPKQKASFIEPMLLLPSTKLPEGANWLYEFKLDGFRAIAFKTNGKVHLRSRNDKDFNTSHPRIVNVLANLPHETVVDGELVALDESGRSSFNALQNRGSTNTRVLYYLFDVRCCRALTLCASRSLAGANCWNTISCRS
jgi:ATP-dependent DNA ligase